MKADELRIGNLVDTVNRNIPIHQPYHIPLKVLTIETTGCRLLSPDKIPAQVEEWPLFQHFDICEIPLTEEWLFRFGFDKIDHIHGYSFYSLSKSKINKCHIDIYENKTEYMSYMVKHCEYVHQLQNLYYAITGSDPTISFD